MQEEITAAYGKIKTTNQTNQYLPKWIESIFLWKKQQD
jgi:hypothetical protein